LRAVAISALCVSLAIMGFGQNPRYQQDPEWRAPTEAASREHPLASKPELAAGGKKLFVRNCVECHGREGTGMESKHSADLQLPIVQEESDGTLFWKITNGNAKHGMPSFSKLPELQRWQVVLYIRTLKPLPPESSIRTNNHKGHEVPRRNSFVILCVLRG
jgi:mono/diheme cytochrome c family protein